LRTFNEIKILFFHRNVAAVNAAAAAAVAAVAAAVAVLS